MTLTSYKSQKKRILRQKEQWLIGGENQKIIWSYRFLISNKSNYINGQDIIVDGG